MKLKFLCQEEVIQLIMQLVKLDFLDLKINFFIIFLGQKLKSIDRKNIVVNYIEFDNFVKPIKKLSGIQLGSYRLNNNL